MPRTLMTLALASMALLAPAGAFGVWGGELDQAHPQVGAMYYDYEHAGAPRVNGLVCTGSYAGESRDGNHDVFLLAGHCLPSPAESIPAGDLYVSFSSNASVANTSQLVADPIQVESYQQMPGAGQNLGDPRDLGVLLLPEGTVPDTLTPVRLAPLGYLDELTERGLLKFRHITIVGYGAQPVWGAGGPTFFVEDGKRRSGTAIVTGLGKALVRLSQNNGIGTGSGQCFGDSGSPQIDENVQPPVVISVGGGGNGQCKATNYDYRVDTPQARAFLDQYLTLP